VLAPTDPVLASAVSVSRASDTDKVRIALTGEAGLNDGMAFPFVALAMGLGEHHGAGPWLWEWAGRTLLWAVPAGLALGFGLGNLVGRIDIGIRTRGRETSSPTDFLALSLIALSYFLAQTLGAWGFLATFAAGVGLRSAEIKAITRSPHPQAPPCGDRDRIHATHPPAEDLVPSVVTDEHAREPAVAAGMLVGEALSLGDTAERLLEVSLVFVIGVVALQHWDVRGLLVSGVLFLAARPVLTQVAMTGSNTTSHQRWLIGWFGIRGIGSLYYLSYALRHGSEGREPALLADLVITVIAVSVLVHGISATPLLRRYAACRG
jgi:NhaP-type Na+/H+ or K+/H+ antiporter